MKRAFLILSLLLPVTMLGNAASAETKLAATIFSYDGADFVRTQTTLMQDGQSAVNTKLDHDSAAYKALSQKQSYVGPRLSWAKTATPTTHPSLVQTAN